MATKAEERQALAKIAKIIEGVGGADSYIGMAMEGCIEMAEENITNDFADSYKGRWERSLMTVEELKAWNNEAKIENEKLTTKVQNLEERAEYVTKIGKEDERVKFEMRDKAEEYKDRADKAEARVADLEAENMKLKAMLFDLMYNK